MPRWPAKSETPPSAPSASVEGSSDLPSSPMAPKPEDEAKPLPSRSPSTTGSLKDGPDADPPMDPPPSSTEPDESMPPADDESEVSSVSSAASNSRSPTPARLQPLTPSATAKKGPPAPQLIGDLVIARTAALDTFDEISDNNYQYKTLGRSREAMEGMTCECTYQHGVDELSDACGHGSNCINRLTQVECLPDDCRCRARCQNQRFQRKEYADIEIVQTEKKGFGLRAESTLEKDDFIYEYVGDVVNPISFKKRMRDYADEGIRHFYFMMLQKDEFIDATKSGGIGRFANHSCNPNCYVAKWTVGAHVRMGIFAKRKITKYEELTFNYNVDRYGHQAQECYCGEPNCVGFIGGKTQTDIVTFDDLYFDALGITDSAALMELKGTKKRKGKKFDDPDFAPAMLPINREQIPKVMQALRQTQSRKMVVKLLTRITITLDDDVLREMMRLRCFSLMKNLLDDYSSDFEIVGLALRGMSTWPLSTRNKVEDSLIEEPVKAFAELEDENIKTLAQKLLDGWADLPLTYRIPKRVVQDEVKEDDSDRYILPMYDDYGDSTPPHKRARLQLPLYNPYVEPRPFRNAPRPWELPAPIPYYLQPTILTPKNPPPRPPSPPLRIHIVEAEQSNINRVINNAIAQKAAADAAAAEAAAAAKAAPPPQEHKKKHRPPKKVQTPQEKEANKEKRLLKLVGAVVVKCMSKYGKSLDRDTFKKHAKELTQLITDKEKKSSSYRDSKLEALSDEKVTKIKKFAKEYIAKVVRKLEKSGHKKRPPFSSATQATSSNLDTPNSADGADAAAPEMTVEEAMDMEPGSDSEGEGEDGEEGDRRMEVDETGDPPAVNAPATPMTEISVQAQPASDPRRRPPNEDPGCRWDPDKQVGKLNGVPIVA
ncbi:hypothetical protein B0H10DRAFT_1984899 [Mycena sp. CBHHK59/15]|nr:hypothetical protein B0H10DRAFT_1984899 [Mycena sp. CBHHK59/15]